MRLPWCYEAVKGPLGAFPFRYSYGDSPRSLLSVMGFRVPSAPPKQARESAPDIRWTSTRVPAGETVTGRTGGAGVCRAERRGGYRGGAPRAGEISG